MSSEIIMEFPELFTRLVQIDTKEKIKIKSKKSSYFINKSLASTISPFFFRALQANPMLQEIYLPINENVEEFFKGKDIDRELFLRMSIILDKEELIKKWKKENEINKDNVYERLMTFIKYEGKIENMVEEFEFIGENFEEIENKIDFDKIPSDHLSQIMKKAKGVKTEETLFKKIIERLKEEEKGNTRKKLIESIEIKGLKKENILDLIENIHLEEASQLIRDITKELFRFPPNFKAEYHNDNDYKNDPTGFLPLHYAAKMNLTDVANIALLKGEDINAKDKNIN